MSKKNLFLRNNKMIKDKYLFLDIDGVLQPYNANNRFEHNMKETIKYLVEKYNTDIYETMDIYDVCAAYYDWDDVAIGILKKIIKESNCKIIVHSGWIEFNNLDQLKALFKLYDLDEYIIDSTQPKIDKRKAIKKYLEQHPEIGEDYVVIDDLDMTLDFGHHFINTNDVITTKDYIQVMISLNNKYEYLVNENQIISKKSEKENIVFDYKIVNVKENNILYLYLNKKETYYHEKEFDVFLNYILGYFKEKHNISCCTIANINEFKTEKSIEFWTKKYSSITANINYDSKTLFIDTIKNGMKGYNFINQNIDEIMKEIE